MIRYDLAESCLDGDMTLADAVKLYSLAIIGAALSFHEGNITATARSLGLNRTTLSEMLQKKMMPQSMIYFRKYQGRPKTSLKYTTCEECGCVVTSQECFGCRAIARALHKACTCTV